MGKYQPYQAYGDSGVLSFGKIPTHWAAKPLKILSTYNDEVLSESTDPDVVIEYVDISSVSATDGIKETTTVNFAAAPSRARRIARDGDVLVSTVRTYLEAIAWVENPPDNMIASTGFAVVRANPSLLNRRYAGYALRARYFIDEVVSRSVGVSYPAINASDLVSIKVPVPALEEQATIAAFLDHETAKIDRLIARQERLIELLKEKRQAVISHAVTKGLNPDAPMKDSGVEWLGEVPAHWEVTQLQRLVDPKRRIMYGIVLPGPNVDEGVPIVKGGDVKPGRLRLSLLCKTTREIESNYARSRIKCGDLVYSIRGTIGDVEIVPAEIAGANLTQDAARIAPSNGIQNVWLKYVLEADQVFRQLEIGSLGAAVKGINIRDLKKALIPLPPTEERDAIANHLDAVLGKLDDLERLAAQQIVLLQEHRTALTSAAVTGKIDVRGWQKPSNEPREAATAANA